MQNRRRSEKKVRGIAEMKGRVFLGVTMWLIVAASIVLVALRLLDVIKWSWIWVLAPIWIPAAMVLLMILGILVIGLFTDFKD